MPLEDRDHLLAGDVDDLDRAVVAGSEQLAVVVEEGQLPDEFEVRLQRCHLVLRTADVGHVQVAVVVTRSHEIAPVRPGQSRQEDLPEFQPFGAFLGGKVEEVDTTQISTGDYTLVQKLKLPILHDCALDDGGVDCVVEGVQVCRS